MKERPGSREIDAGKEVENHEQQTPQRQKQNERGFKRSHRAKAPRQFVKPLVVLLQCGVFRFRWRRGAHTVSIFVVLSVMRTGSTILGRLR